MRYHVIAEVTYGFPDLTLTRTLSGTIDYPEIRSVDHLERFKEHLGAIGRTIGERTDAPLKGVWVRSLVKAR